MAFSFSKITDALKGSASSGSVSSIVGVDVGTSAIKVVQLKNAGGTATLETYGELQLGPYETTDVGRVTNLPVPKLTEAFVDIARESSVNAKHVTLAISYGASFATIINVATNDPNKLESMIPVEAKKYIPIPLNEVAMDWFQIPTNVEGKGLKVLLVAIHKDPLNRYDAMVSGAGLQMKFTEIEIFSTIRSSMANGDDTVAIVDLGASATKVYIARSGIISKTHSVRMSGVELTKALAESQDIGFIEAEELKRDMGLKHEEGKKALTSVLERGFSEIQRVIKGHTEEEKVKVEKVILTGGGALLKGIDVYAADVLQHSVVLSDPFSKVAYPAFLEDTLKTAGPTFSVAVGAALRGIVTD